MLLKRLADGESGAYQECIALYGALIWGLALRLSKTKSDAEAATQEIFLEIWLQAGRFEAAGGVEHAFIFKIARKRLIDRLRASALATPPVPCDAGGVTPQNFFLNSAHTVRGADGIP